MSAALLDRIIRSHAERRGATAALVSCGRSTDALSWRELDEASGRLAARARELVSDAGRACLVVTLADSSAPRYADFQFK